MEKGTKMKTKCSCQTEEEPRAYRMQGPLFDCDAGSERWSFQEIIEWEGGVLFDIHVHDVRTVTTMERTGSKREC